MGPRDSALCPARLSSISIGHIAFVQDRCAYTLLSRSGLEVMAIFKTRRREDASFLDKVILRYNGVDFNLGQGGIVQVSYLQKVTPMFKKCFKNV